MSQKAALAALDASIHSTLAAAGLADTGLYTPKGGGAAVACNVYVGRGMQAVGELGQLRAERLEVGYVLGSMAPTVPALAGTLVVDGDTFVNAAPADEDDGSIAWWVVRRG